MNILKAFKAFWRALTDNEAPEAVKTAPEISEPPKPELEKVDKTKIFEDGAVFTLTLLQREGRLIDFLCENIDSYDDSQIGAAVRQIHSSCSKVVKERFALEQIIDGTEGTPAEAPEKFDPSEIRLTGNPPSEAPYKGTLQHKGWIAKEVKLPTRSEEINAKVVCPAEISF
jgi:hypothetical protein